MGLSVRRLLDHTAIALTAVAAAGASMAWASFPPGGVRAFRGPGNAGSAGEGRRQARPPEARGGSVPPLRGRTGRRALAAPAQGDEDRAVTSSRSAGLPASGGPDARFGAARTGHTHQGQDVIAAEGTPLVAVRRGLIAWSGYLPGEPGITWSSMQPASCSTTSTCTSSRAAFASTRARGCGRAGGLAGSGRTGTHSVPASPLRSGAATGSAADTRSTRCRS